MMSYRFTLAAVTAAITLTGCAKQQTSSDQPENYFQGPSQIAVSHVVTRADDGSDIFLTIDGNDAGPLIAGQSNQISVPAGKHKVGGYAATMLGLGRVTIEPVEITTKPGELTQVAYSVTKTKPVFVNEGVTKLPVKPKPAPEPVQPEAPAEASQNAATVQATPGDSISVASANTPQSTSVTTSPAAATTDSTQAASGEVIQRGTTASGTTQPATTTTETTQSTTQPTTTETTQSTTQPTTTETTQSTTQPTTTDTTQSTTQSTTTETTQSSATDSTSTDAQ